MKLSFENKERLIAQGCAPEHCMYWNTKTCLQCSKGVLWRELLKEAGHEQNLAH